MTKKNVLEKFKKNNPGVVSNILKVYGAKWDNIVEEYNTNPAFSTPTMEKFMSGDRTNWTKHDDTVMNDIIKNSIMSSLQKK